MVFVKTAPKMQGFNRPVPTQAPLKPTRAPAARPAGKAGGKGKLVAKSGIKPSSHVSTPVLGRKGIHQGAKPNLAGQAFQRAFKPTQVKQGFQQGLKPNQPKLGFQQGLKAKPMQAKQFLPQGLKPNQRKPGFQHGLKPIQTNQGLKPVQFKQGFKPNQPKPGFQPGLKPKPMQAKQGLPQRFKPNQPKLGFMGLLKPKQGFQPNQPKLSFQQGARHGGKAAGKAAQHGGKAAGKGVRHGGKAAGKGVRQAIPKLAANKKGKKPFGSKTVAKPENKVMEKLANIDASRKMWVGGLSEGTSFITLMKHIQEVAGVKPKLIGILPKGRACVAFKTADDADSARGPVNDAELEGKTLTADVWKQREKTEKQEKPAGTEGKKNRRSNKKKGAAPAEGPLKVLKTGFAKRNANAKKDKAVRGDPKIREKLAKVDNELKVWVGGMKTETSYGQLRKWFAEAGHKTNFINLSGKDRACVSFKTAEQASDAIAALNGNSLDGSTLEVDVWTQASQEEIQARREEQKQRKAVAKAEK